MLKNQRTLSRKVFLFLISLILIFSILFSNITIIEAKKIGLEKIEPQKLLKNKDIEDFYPEMISQVNQSKLKRYIQKIQDFGPHPTGSKAVEEVGKYLYNKLSKMNLDVEYDDWNYKRKSGKNIIATIKGTAEKESIVVVCAHYDTVDISPGADDDGSGIACVLMIAEIMCNYTFNSTVRFILFSGEEGGCFGSHEYARKAKERGDNILCVLAIDKVGYAETKEDGKYLRHHANDESEWMIDISQNISNSFFDLLKIKVMRLTYDTSSDHKSFVNYGFKGSNFVENALNPTYHTSEDTIEYINFSYLTKVCKISLCTISKISSLNPLLSDSDVNIKMRGNFLSRLSQFEIDVINKNFQLDTANVTIKIEMKHLLRNIYVKNVKTYYSTPCSWNFTKEIQEKWTFQITSRKFTRGLFILKVTVRGFKDDINLYKKDYTYGLINHPFVIRLVPII
jgi:hypothetical protein